MRLLFAEDEKSLSRAITAILKKIIMKWMLSMTVRKPLLTLNAVLMTVPFLTS